MRLIDADALKENLFIKFGNQLPNGLLNEIDNAPTVERPQGEWEFSRVADNDLDEIIRCSVCHRFDMAKYIDGRNPYYDYPAFCRCCGASMKKGVWK